MGGKKIIFLFLALLLPVLIFLFLKVFGRNRFDVPLLYESGVVDKPAECHFSYPAPYVLHDSTYHLFHATNASLVMVNFSNPSSKLRQLGEQFKKDGIVLMEGKQLNLPEPDLNILKKCLLLMPASQSVVLVDNSKRIRGYYDGTDPDDLDRLEAELKIILNKY